MWQLLLMHFPDTTYILDTSVTQAERGYVPAYSAAHHMGYKRPKNAALWGLMIRENEVTLVHLDGLKLVPIILCPCIIHSKSKISSSQKESQGDGKKSEEWMLGMKNNNLATEGNCSNNKDSQTLLSAKPYTNWFTSSQQISGAGTHKSSLRLWNKWPQARWLKHTEMYSLIILEPRSLKSRFQ